MASLTLSDEEVVRLKSMVAPLMEDITYTSDGRPLQLERPWQYYLVNSSEYWQAWNKSRQIGFSYGDAIRSLGRAFVFPNGTYSKVFVSINREEAEQKIRYVQELYESIPKTRRIERLYDNKMGQEFANGNRILSWPSRAVRGLPNVDLTLDEAAHIEDITTIYKGSTGSTIRGGYGVTVGSTPYGRGLFKDICTGAGKDGEYKNFRSFTVPWWRSQVLCKDVRAARLWAPGMRTEERVRFFGQKRLIEEFEGHVLDSFRQEFEAYFFDTGESALSEDLILARSDGTMEDFITWEVDFAENISFDNAAAALDVLIKKLQYQKHKESWDEFVFVGMDVGREINATEIIICFMRHGHLHTKAYFTLRRAPYQIQEHVVRQIMNNLPVKRFVIDSTGTGDNMAEVLYMEYGEKLVPMKFSINSKEDMVAALVKAFEADMITIYPTRRMHNQLLSVKKVESEAGRLLYKASQSKDDDDSGNKSHADLFWALAMCVYGADAWMIRKVIITKRSPILMRRGGSNGKILIPRPHILVPRRR